MMTRLFSGFRRARTHRAAQLCSQTCGGSQGWRRQSDAHHPEGPPWLPLLIPQVSALQFPLERPLPARVYTRSVIRGMIKTSTTLLGGTVSTEASRGPHPSPSPAEEMGKSTRRTQILIWDSSHCAPPLAPPACGRYLGAGQVLGHGGYDGLCPASTDNGVLHIIVACDGPQGTQHFLHKVLQEGKVGVSSG